MHTIQIKIIIKHLNLINLFINGHVRYFYSITLKTYNHLK